MASAGFMLVTAAGVDIRGGSTVSSLDRADTIEVAELKHDVAMSTEAVDASPSGHRTHQPLRVIAHVDKALPLMYKAWANNEPCEVTIRFFKPDLSGVEQLFFTIRIENARLVGVNLHWPNSLYVETAGVPEQVEYLFIYSTISWEMAEGGIGHQDDWYENL